MTVFRSSGFGKAESFLKLQGYDPLVYHARGFEGCVGRVVARFPGSDGRFHGAGQCAWESPCPAVRASHNLSYIPPAIKLANNMYKIVVRDR